LIQINHILGHSDDMKYSSHLHDLSHKDKVEYIVLDHANLKRRRFRTTTDKGTDCAITLPRTEYLTNGAVLIANHEQAIVVKMAKDEWLSLQPHDLATAIELGYFAGNMHWRVKFEQQHLKIALENPIQNYLERLQVFFESGRIERVYDER
jgi:urease accessory protein